MISCPERRSRFANGSSRSSSRGGRSGRERSAPAAAHRPTAPDPGVGESLCVDRAQHLVHERLSLGGRDGHPEAVPIEPEPDQVAGAHRHIRVEQHLLRHISDRPVPPAAGAAAETDLAGARAWRPRITRNNVVLPAPLEPIRPVNSPAATVKVTPSRICRPPSATLTPSTASTSPSTGSLAPRFWSSAITAAGWRSWPSRPSRSR